MSEKVPSVAQLMFPGEAIDTHEAEPVIVEAEYNFAPTSDVPNAVYVPPLPTEMMFEPRTVRQDPIVTEPRMGYREAFTQPFYRRKGFLLIVAGLACSAAGGLLANNGSLTVNRPSAAATRGESTPLPSSSTTAGPFAGGTIITSESPSPTPTPSTIDLNHPIVLGTDKNHSVTSAHAIVGAFNVLFSFNGQLNDMSFPGGTISFKDSSSNIQKTTKKNGVDTQNNIFIEDIVLSSKSINHTSNMDVSLAAISDKVISSAQQLTAQGDISWCKAFPTSASCPKGPTPTSNLSPGRLQSVRASIEILAFYAAQQKCASYASQLLLQNINASEDAFAITKGVPPEDVTVLYDKNTAPNYIKNPVAHLSSLGGVTTPQGLKLAFGSNVSIPITCKP